MAWSLHGYTYDRGGQSRKNIKKMFPEPEVNQKFHHVTMLTNHIAVLQCIRLYENLDYPNVQI